MDDTDGRTCFYSLNPVRCAGKGAVRAQAATAVGNTHRRSRCGQTDGQTYLGDLSGPSAHRKLIRLGLRGTGRSAVPQNLASCRYDRLVDDIEALRRHLGLDHTDLLAHSAGDNLAVRYVSRHPERVDSGRGHDRELPGHRAVLLRPLGRGGRGPQGG
ncbi:alpha/beta fold hydrolase [Streptomyces sp. CG1]|uniref:alpha/beta fold hydrolase n=1 Tax=Streptomyces sp. CG1 TaxID=1287523 RepID=UPI0034E2C337